jgi:signal transduction histidine kinase
MHSADPADGANDPGYTDYPIAMDRPGWYGTAGLYEQHDGIYAACGANVLLVEPCFLQTIRTVTMIPHSPIRSLPALRPDEIPLLIADVAALTGVAPPQLRSWEQAGLLHPRRSPKAIRLYGIEDVARVRLVKRTMVNPGRRGSLRRLMTELASGTLRPSPEDYAGLLPASTEPVPLTAADYWEAVVAAQAELIVVCDRGGRMTYANAALLALLTGEASRPVHLQAAHGAAPPPSTNLPSVLGTLPLWWAAQTGTHHHDVAVLLPGPTGAEVRTLWNVTPLRTRQGALQGAVGVGRQVPSEHLAQREEVFATAAHDLRSPVTTILGRIELARRTWAALRAADPTFEQLAATPRLEEHLAKAMLGTVDLMHTMGTLIDAAASAHGALSQQMDPAGVALRPLALRAVEHARQHTSRHLFTLEAPSAPLLVVGDPVRLGQVFDNLLGNAVKYAPDGGPITLTLEHATALPRFSAGADPPRHLGAGPGPAWAVIRVQDSGVGIPAAALPHVFDRFWRAEDTASTIRGTGLGLYTSRAVVEAHGGHIWVERSMPMTKGAATEDDRHGTVMAVVLPLAPLTESMAAAVDASAGPAGPREE